MFVKEFASQRVTVSGAVNKPGIFPVTSRLSLLQAVSLAEGLDDVASEHNVVVFRRPAASACSRASTSPRSRQASSADPEMLGEDVVVVDASDRRGRAAER